MPRPTRNLISPCECDRVPVLCGCGWGQLALPACKIPSNCPVCDFDLWSYGGVPDPCQEVSQEGQGGPQETLR